MINLSCRFALEIAAQDDGLAREEALEPLRIVDGKHLAEAQLDPRWIVPSQNLAAKREVNVFTPRPISPVAFIVSYSECTRFPRVLPAP